MPFIITAGVKPDTYMVRNAHSGKIHSYASSLDDASKQLHILNHIIYGGGDDDETHHVGGEEEEKGDDKKEYDEYYERGDIMRYNKVLLPMVGDISFIVPPFLVQEREGEGTKYPYKLVNPLTQERNLSSRAKKLNINLYRKLTPSPDISVKHPKYEDLPELKQFDKADRRLIMKYQRHLMDALNGEAPINDGYGTYTDYKSIPNVKYYNQPRGYPTHLHGNIGKPKREGYVDVKAYLKGEYVDKYNRNDKIVRREQEIDADKYHIREYVKLMVIAESGDFDKQGELEIKKEATTIFNNMTKGGKWEALRLVKERLGKVKETKDKKVAEDIKKQAELRQQEMEQQAELYRKGLEPKQRGRPRIHPVIAQEDKKPVGRPKKADKELDKSGMGISGSSTEPDKSGSSTEPLGRSSKSNKWILYVKKFAKEQGITYREALRDPECKSGYKKGGELESGGSSKEPAKGGSSKEPAKGGSLFKTTSGKITHQSGVKNVVVGNKRGFGVIDEGIDAGYLGRTTKLGAEKSFISL